MKKFVRPLIVAMVAVPTLFTACSKPEVSEEVAALRQTQVDLFNERVEKQRLDNALTELEIELAAAKNASAIALANLEAQKYSDSLELYLRTQGLEQAADLLDLYTGALGDAVSVQGDKIEQEALIAEMQQLIGAQDPTIEEENLISFELASKIIQRDLDKLEATLAAQQAALVILEGVEADPSSAQTEIAEIWGTLQGYENDKAALQVEIVKAQQAADAGWDALGDAQDLIEDYEAQVSDIAGAEGDIADKEAEIAAKQDEIAMFEIDLIDANTAATTAQNALNNATTALAPYLAAIGAAEADLNAAQNAEYQAQIDYNIVLNDFNNGNATQAELDAAQADLDAAIAATNDANAALNDAETDAAGPQNTYDAALFVRDAAQAAVDNLEANIVTANNDLADLNDDLAQLQETLGDEQQDVANLQADYDTAVSSLVQLEDDAEAAQDVVNGLWDQYWVIDNNIGELWDVLDVLEGQLEAINESIEDLRDDIEDTEITLEQKAKMLDDNTISETEWLAAIAVEEEHLANLNAEYEAYMALAAGYLAAYNDALASQDAS
ncbi:hypothetical protein [Flagellimonas sp. GZD32]|uniref:hypothetical protein n=1 Tax=Flagellimonas cixiensis TaxID=3228750 RepID=UPI0035C92215